MDYVPQNIPILKRGQPLYKAGCSTYTVVVSFYDLQEECGTILHGLGEDLKQVAIVIKIH